MARSQPRRERDPRKDPDRLLAREQFPRLNERFYSSRPWEYFRVREHALLLMAGASEQAAAILQEGVEVGKLRVTLPCAADEQEAAEGKQAVERYVLTESVALMQHAVETLLRLYLAHEVLPECPWLELARTRTPGAFKRLVQERFAGDLPESERRARVAAVFFGSRERDAEGAMPEQVWLDGTANLEAFLYHFAREFLDADIYNSLKHGFAVQAGDSLMQLGDGELLKADGPAVEFLSIREDEHGYRLWNITTRWIEVDRTIAMTFIATQMMESIWNIARARYLRDLPVQVRPWTHPTFRDAMNRLEPGQDSAVFVEQGHMPLTYYIDPNGPPEQWDGAAPVRAERGQDDR